MVTEPVAYTYPWTYLQAGQQTRGHSREAKDEVYEFLHIDGRGVMLRGNDTLVVEKDQIVYVPKGVFHRVINPTKGEMIFETISPGRIARPAIPRPGEFSQSLQKLQSP
jgi:mannose-6-phosphate isomerase-like protein (cupin superfamily)